MGGGTRDEAPRTSAWEARRQMNAPSFYKSRSRKAPDVTLRRNAKSCGHETFVLITETHPDFMRACSIQCAQSPRGGGGTPLRVLNGDVRPDRVWFLKGFDLNRVSISSIFVLKKGTITRPYVFVHLQKLHHKLNFYQFANVTLADLTILAVKRE